MKKSLKVFLSAGLGAAAIVLLKLQDQVNTLSAVLVLIAITGLLYGVRHASCRKERLIVAGITAAAFIFRLWEYITVPAVDILLGLIFGLLFFGLLSAERLLKKYENRPWYTLIFPTLYFLLMYLSETLKFNLPLRFDTYLSNLPLLCGITSLLGIYILEFLLGWTASVLVYILDHKSVRKTLLLAAAYALVLCGVLCFGAVHQNQMQARENAKTDRVRVAYTTGPYVGVMSEEFAFLTPEENVVSLQRSVESAAEGGAEILLFNEEAFTIDDNAEAMLLETAQSAAKEHHIHLVLAYEIADTDNSDEGKGINKLCWISDEGEILDDYIKYCLVPLVETGSYVRGDGNVSPFEITVHGKTLKVATGICYDCDFEIFMNRFGKDCDLFFFPTWDWDAIRAEHFGVARLRAISAETTLIRSVYDGWSAVIDSAGTLLNCTNPNTVGYETVQFCDVPIK